MLNPDCGFKLVFLLLSSWQSSSIHRKARRKDRDGDQTVPDTKPYLDENVLERKLPDADLRTIVDLPPGLDYNEWLASHSEYSRGLGYIEGRGKGKEKDRDEMKSVNYKCRLVVAPFRWRHDDGARFCVVML